MLPPFIMKLYYYPVSAPSRAILIFCKHNDIPHELVHVDLEAGEHKHPTFLEISPSHTVPVVKDKKITLFQGPTILRYMCNVHELESWYPKDVVVRSLVDRYLDWHQENLRKASTLVLELTTGGYNGFSGHNPQQPIMSADDAEPLDMEKVGNAMKRYIEAVKVLESKFLASNDFLAGDKITIADLYAATELDFHTFFNADLSNFPKVLAWLERTKASLSSWNEVNEEFQSVSTTLMEKIKKQQAEQYKKQKYGGGAKGGTKPPDISHTIYFQLPLPDVYLLLTSEDKLSTALNSPCELSAKPGGGFTLYDQAIQGTNLYFLENSKMLQSWRFNDWPPNTQCTVKTNFESADAGDSSLTLVTMTCSDVPLKFLQKTDDWWLDKFWRPLGGVPTRNILQQVFFESRTPHDIFETLTETTKLAKVTGKKCETSRNIGGTNEYLDGFISSVNLDLITDALIIQKWRASDWPKEHFSQVKMELSRVAGGTDLLFTQRNVPVDKYRNIQELWEKNFWRKMRREVTQ